MLGEGPGILCVNHEPDDSDPHWGPRTTTTDWELLLRMWPNLSLPWLWPISTQEMSAEWMNGPSLNASLPLVFLFPWAIPPRCQALSPPTQISVPLICVSRSCGKLVKNPHSQAHPSIVTSEAEPRNPVSEVLLVILMTLGTQLPEEAAATLYVSITHNGDLLSVESLLALVLLCSNSFCNYFTIGVWICMRRGEGEKNFPTWIKSW